MPEDVFKIIGGTDPATSNLGNMTQGLGFPLRPVEPSAAVGTLQLQTRTVLDARSFVDQQPVALDTPIQLTLGDAQATAEFDVDAAGVATCLITGEYTFRFRLLFGRTGTPLTAILFGRILINGLQVSTPVHTLIADAATEIPARFEAVIPMTVGDTLTLQIYRDSAGTDAGGVFASTATLAGWGTSPSVIVLATESVAFTV